jgi:hypothetical protein
MIRNKTLDKYSDELRSIKYSLSNIDSANYKNPATKRKITLIDKRLHALNCKMDLVSYDQSEGWELFFKGVIILLWGWGFFYCYNNIPGTLLYTTIAMLVTAAPIAIIIYYILSSFGGSYYR